MERNDVLTLGHVHVEPLTFVEALEVVEKLACDAQPHLVVTPNIAHVYQSRKFPELRDAYRSASLSVPDGWPVVSALRLFRTDRRHVERVTGVDLMNEICNSKCSVALVGGADDAAVIAATKLKYDNPSLNIVSVETAPRHELVNDESRERLIARISSTAPDYIFVGLGVPRQEAFALELLQNLDRGVVFCVGAAIEFAAGRLQRAPRFAQKYKLEWLHRLVSEPRKLAGRYLLAAPYFLAVVASEYARRASQRGKMKG